MTAPTLRHPFAWGLWACALGAGLLLFLIWYPGIITADGWFQWREAISGRITNWHPVWVTMVITMILKVAPGLSPNSQLGIEFLAQSMTIYLSSCLFVLSISDNRSTRWIMMVAFVLYYPLWFALALVYKDAWFFGFLLLTLAFFFRYTRSGSWGDVLGIAVAAGLTILNRHTAGLSLILLSPVLLLIIRDEPFGGSWRTHAKPIAAVIVGWIIAAVVTKLVLVVKIANFANLILLFDVFGIVSRSSAPIESFAHLKTYQEVGHKAFFQGLSGLAYNGMSDYLIFSPDSIYPPDRVLATKNALWDLASLSRTNPGEWIEFKVLMLMQMLGISRYDFLYTSSFWNAAGSPFTAHPLLPGVKAALMERMVPGLVSTSLLYKIKLWNWPIYHYIPLTASLILNSVMLMCPRRLSPYQKSSLALLWAGMSCLIPFLLLSPGGTFRYMMASNVLWWLSVLLALMALSQSLRKNLKPAEQVGHPGK